jgi:hypothetical protein
VGNPREGAHTRVPHQVAVADNHLEVAAVRSRRPVAVGSHRLVAAVVVGSHRPVAAAVVGSHRPAAAVVVGSHRPAAVAAGGSCQEAAEVGSSPEEGVADQSCGLPGSFVSV